MDEKKPQGIVDFHNFRRARAEKRSKRVPDERADCEHCGKKSITRSEAITLMDLWQHCDIAEQFSGRLACPECYRALPRDFTEFDHFVEFDPKGRQYVAKLPMDVIQDLVDSLRAGEVPDGCRFNLGTALLNAMWPLINLQQPELTTDKILFPEDVPPGGDDE